MNETKAKAEYRRQVILFCCKATHEVISILLFFLAWMLFQHFNFVKGESIAPRYNYLVTIGYAFLLTFFNRTYNSYLLGHIRNRTLVFAQFISQLFAVILVYLVVSISWAKLYSPLVFLPMLLLQLIVDIAWVQICNRLYFRVYPPKKTILIYRNLLDRQRFGSIKGKPSENLFVITRELEYNRDSFHELRPYLEGFDAIFVAGVNSRCRNGILKYCKEECVPGFFLPHVGDVIMREAAHIQSFDSPVLYINRKHISPEYRVCKRAFDIVGAAAGLIVLSPILLLTALVIRLYDGGPAIYKQVRLTRDGRRFVIYKFRSMQVDAEKDGIPRLSTGDLDDRVTPIGRIVRKCRLDELPQLFNILKGDMSFVGPRPERPEIHEEYCKQMPDFNLRLQVKAGLTGYAQVYGRYNTDPYEKLEFDLLYINNMSILTDIQLMFATFAILFLPESTEGIREGQLTPIDPVEKGGDAFDQDRAG